MPLFVLAAPLLAVAVIGIAGLRAPLRLLLAIYAGILPFGSGIAIPGPLPPPFNTLTTLLGVVTTGAILINLALVPRRASRIPVPVALWLVFLGVVGLTFIWSVEPSTTADDYTVIVSLIVLYSVAAFMPVERADLGRLEGAIAAGGAISGLYALFLTATNTLPLTGSGTPRFATAGGVGEGADANITAAALLLPLAVAAGRAMRRSEPPALRWAFGAAAALTGAAIAMTGSRGGMLASLIAIIILILHERRRSVVATFVVGGVLVLGLTAAVAPDALLGHVGKNTSSGRTDIWKIGLNACQTYCWKGAGWATFPEVYRRVEGQTPAASAPHAQLKAHNIALRLMIESGFAGLLVALLAIAATVRDVARIRGHWRAIPLAGLVAVLVANMFLSNIDFKYFWLALMYGTLSTMVEAPRERTVPQLTPGGRRLVTVG